MVLIQRRWGGGAVGGKEQVLEVKSQGLVQRHFMYKDISCFMHSKNTKDFKIFLYEDFSCFFISKNTKDFKFFYIKIPVVLSSVKIQRISSFSSFFLYRDFSCFNISKKTKEFKIFLYKDFSYFIISKNKKVFPAFFVLQISVVLSSVKL